MADKKEWVVIYYHYGRHCDEFEVDKVTGPYTFEEASDIESVYDEEGYTTISRYELP